MSLWAGLGGGTRYACVSLCADDEIVGICEQERITRVRAAGLNSTGLPDEALDELLLRSRRHRGDITAYAIAEDDNPPVGVELVRLNHHFAHACAAFLPSPFESATIIVCDHDSPRISVWDGEGDTLTEVAWPWHGIGFAELYSQCAEAIGFSAFGREQRMEALARLEPGRHEMAAERLFHLAEDRLSLAPDWKTQVESWIRSAGLQKRSWIAAALQSRIGDLLIEFCAEARRRAPARRHLCVGGSLFNNSHFNSMVKRNTTFDRVFVPINPGNPGLAVGNALHVSTRPRRVVTPFLGPSYSSEDIKATLDNCKLTYQWTSESDRLAIVVRALLNGRLVGWFDGPMEWGPRALGARSILASPFCPYVLDNLNQFLKQRDPRRGYALSGLETSVREHFDGPDASPFMECDYAPKDRKQFGYILPGPTANVRVHTVGSDAPPRFRALLHAFGEETGIPILVNTSFNGFREPMVCSPRDAVRVFYGTGIDVLAVGQFVISK
jgi:carbamoyltransferase